MNEENQFVLSSNKQLSSVNTDSTPSKVHQFLHGSVCTLEQVMKQRKDSLFAKQQQRRAEMIQKKRGQLAPKIVQVEVEEEESKE